MSECCLKYDSINELFESIKYNQRINELKLDNNNYQYVDNRQIKIFLNDNT